MDESQDYDPSCHGITLPLRSKRTRRSAAEHAEAENGRGIQPKREHWGRFAFLRSCTEKFRTMTIAEKNKRSLWEYIDDELAFVHASFKELSKTERAIQEGIFFANLLGRDTTTYIATSGELTRRVYSSNEVSHAQSSVEEAVATFAVDDRHTGEAEPEVE
ncbi:hypothetical protein NEOLEDRAFT_1127251 [Neolentinus lepideus HHB14362 ss-1]|uniref:Uncharacterized protein n=1 Tax=Neolentinus lepideus HHB14362 ss-1 TaxID=1314782 RepID=A0A165VWA8_9AGAM|nr:hypothetical protein NEOLEDRAFT_1127251 [Neolentinus lepideus HHB14362 ss-1]